MHIPFTWRVMAATTVCGVVAQAQPKESGNLVGDGIPEIPRRIVDRTLQYANTRDAMLVDFDRGDTSALMVTRFGETAQVHHVTGPSMDRTQWTFFPEPVTWAAYDPVAPGDGFFFRMDSGGGEFYQYHWYDRLTGKSTLLTNGTSRNESWLVSPSGGKAVFTSTARNKVDFDIHLAMPGPHGWAGGSPVITRIKEVKGQWNAVDWSPNEKDLLVVNYVSANESYLHVLNLASGKLTPVNAHKPAKVMAYGPAVFSRQGNAVFYASDEDSQFQRLTRLDLTTGHKEILTPTLRWDVTALAASKDGAHLAVVTNEGGVSAVSLASLAELPFALHKLDAPKGVLSTLLFDAPGERLGFSMSTPNSSSEVYVASVGTGDVARWTWSELGGVPQSGFVEPQLVEFASFDGLKIPAWWYRPATPSATPSPTVVVIHGGPEAQAQAYFEPTIQYWVHELGVNVLVPNVRGSRGYGKTYTMLDNGFKREDSVKDIGALLDWMAAQPSLDPQRVAVYGGSYGGYMVLAALSTYPQRLRCGVDIVGISQFVTFLEKTEDYRKDLRRVEYGDERVPKMRQFLESISPANHASLITAPLLVVQGFNDPRVPVGQSESMVKTLRAQGNEVWYLMAKDEGHGFQKKHNRDVLMQTATLFLEQHLLPVK